MSRLKKLQEKQKQLNRFQALKSIFSSFVLTVTAVVVVVVTVPKSPEGIIENYQAFNNAITYTVNVTDSDNAIIEDTLQVTLENQTDEYYQVIDIGTSSGIFEDLEFDTEYKLKILANKGFGLEVLDSQTINTEPTTGGAITGIELVAQDEWSYSYNINYYISDPQSIYSNIQIRYGVLYEGEEEIFHYMYSYDLTNETSYLLESVSENSSVYIYLEATNQDSEVVILDEIVFNTPYKPYGYLYLDSISNNSAVFSFYSDGSSNVEVEYEVRLLQHGYTVASQIVETIDFEEEFHHEGQHIEFLGLDDEMNYQVELVAKYNDPNTLDYKEVVLVDLEINTLPDYQIDLEVIDYDTYYEVIVYLVDELDFYDQIGFSILEITDMGSFVLETQNFMFETIDDQKTVTFTITKPALQEYIIEIYLKDSSEYTHRIILKEIIETEEVI